MEQSPPELVTPLSCTVGEGSLETEIASPPEIWVNELRSTDTESPGAETPQASLAKLLSTTETAPHG